MAFLTAFVHAFWIRLLVLFDGLAALVRLAGMALSSVSGTDGTFLSRFKAKTATTAGLRTGFAVSRAFLPNLLLSQQLISAYDNTGTAIVTRFDDMKDVLRRDQDFEVVYAPRMARITGGANFFLGMQDTPDYSRDVANMRLAVRRDDLPGLVAPFAAKLSADLVQASGGRIDVPQDLSLRVPAQFLRHYFGIPGRTEAELIDWTTVMFWYLFADLKADPALDQLAVDSAAQCRTYLDALIQERKASPGDRDDILNRCLAMQRAGLPGMDDICIRNNMIGLIIGAVPTISKAAVQALDQLLDRPLALERAQRAARADDDALLARYVWEALRFAPVNPVIYRRATRDTMIAPNTLRATRVPKSTMVLAANLSAMFDRKCVDNPNSFQIDRPWDQYILWGGGLHTCFGAHINQVLVPAILKPLLRQQGLRRAAGGLGQIDTGGTPFPVHMWLLFKAA